MILKLAFDNEDIMQLMELRRQTENRREFLESINEENLKEEELDEMFAIMEAEPILDRIIMVYVNQFMIECDFLCTDCPLNEEGKGYTSKKLFDV